ncbi:unnamed protein product [Calicophoron daubneyi]|uniref:Uncharacterized protein n=1 Tax=Calicophoron daubneyi TaxID=300641 RepID=A0AAV2SZN4_CALDB
MWNTGDETATPFSNSYEHDSLHPIVYSSLPDKSVRVDCIKPTEDYAHLQITGYVRRLRISWNLIGALAPGTAVPVTKASETTEITAANVTDATSLSSNYSNLWQGGENYHSPNVKLLHPDLGVRIRLTARMLFDGNFSAERKRTLCEFFSGFWCPTQVTRNTSSSPQTNYPSSDPEPCIQATMRCDNLPDCDPTRPVRDIQSSADEANCDYVSMSFSGNRSERTGSFNQTDRWTSRLPWIVLAPVPLVLVCALVRICSQKRHLDLADDDDLNRWHDPTTMSKPVLTTVQSDSTIKKRRPLDGMRCVRSRKRILRQHLGFIPSTALSSVAEVDEHEGDSRTGGNLANSELSEASMPEELEKVQESARLTAPPTLTEWEFNEDTRTFRRPTTLTKTRSTLSLPSDYVADSLYPPTVSKSVAEAPEDRRRTFLCWPVRIDLGSSSTSSSSSDSQNSQQEGSRMFAFLRSHSYDDVLQVDTNADPTPNDVELQILKSRIISAFDPSSPSPGYQKESPWIEEEMEDSRLTYGNFYPQPNVDADILRQRPSVRSVSVVADVSNPPSSDSYRSPDNIQHSGDTDDIELLQLPLSSLPVDPDEISHAAHASTSRTKLIDECSDEYVRPSESMSPWTIMIISFCTVLSATLPSPSSYSQTTPYSRLNCEPCNQSLSGGSLSLL